MGWLEERGIEMYEVLQVLDGPVRRPVPGRDGFNRSVLGISGRTKTGRVLRVALRPVEGRNWEILIAAELHGPELDDYLKWEAGRA